MGDKAPNTDRDVLCQFCEAKARYDNASNQKRTVPKANESVLLAFFIVNQSLAVCVASLSLLCLSFFLFQCLDEAVKAGRRTVAPKQRDKDLGWIAAVIKARDKVVKVNALDSRSSPRTVNVP